MKQNMGRTDRVIRTLAGLVIFALILSGVLSGVLAWILGILAAVLILTSAFSVCPGYVPLHLSTAKKTESPQ
jgi:hypothetical protein